MGQVGIVQGIIQFVLHCCAVIAALAVSGLLSGKAPLWKTGLVCIATFAAAFIAHIIAFIVLKAILGGPVPPEIHRPVVGMVWGLVSAIILVLMNGGRLPLFWPGAFLTTCAYYIFVLLRPVLP